MKIRTYQANTDQLALKQAAIGLQEFERKLDPRMPDGDSIADQYLDQMFEECQKFDGIIFVAEIEQQLAGYLTLHCKHVSSDIDDGPREFGHITDVFVSDGFRAKGVGKALLNHAENYARAKGVKEIMLGVMAENSPALKLYQDLGYTAFAVKLEKQL